MLVKGDLTSKDTTLRSSGICTVFIALRMLSVDCSLCRDSSVKGLRVILFSSRLTQCRTSFLV